MAKRLERRLCGLATFLGTLIPSYANGGGTGPFAVSFRLGGGAAHVNLADHRRISRSRSECPINAEGIRGAGLCALGVH